MRHWFCVVIVAAAGGRVMAGATALAAATSVLLGSAWVVAADRPDFADVRPRPQQSFGQTVDRALKYILDDLDRNEQWKKTNAVKDNG